MNYHNGLVTEKNSITGLPAYNLFSLNGGYEVNEHLRLRFGVDNLFNKAQAQLCPGGVCEAPAVAPAPVRWTQGAVLVVFLGVFQLGLSYLLSDGTLARSGGRLVKNVTGYDMPKLLTGSYGTLAALTEITVKVLPAPERIRTVLRRASAMPGATPTRLRGWTFDGWTFDAVRRELRDPDGAIVALSSLEFRLLELLLQNANQVLTRDRIMEATAGRPADPFERRIDIAISRLRARLRDDGREPRLIKTVRNRGYVLTADIGSS